MKGMRRLRLELKRLAAVMLAGGLAGGLLAGCATPEPADGPTADAPRRDLTWFAYLAGEDLRARCAPDAPEHYRLVFNADHNQRVRAYEIIADQETGGAELRAQVIRAADVARVDPSDPLGAWRGEAARVILSPQDFALLSFTLYQSGAFDPMQPGLRMPANGFYWLANGCHGGRWFFTVHPYPTDRFADVRAPDPELLFGAWSVAGLLPP